jgi:outer membrane cobalamin receptor
MNVSWSANAQNCNVHGRLLNKKDDSPVPYAAIKAGNLGCLSDENGEFTIALPAGKCKLQIHAIDFQDIEQTIDVRQGGLELGVLWCYEDVNFGGPPVLVFSASKHQQKIEEVTVSMEVIQPKLFQDKNITSLEDGLQQAPGVSIVDDEPQIRSGSGYSFGAGSRVQVLIDDIPILSGDAGKASWAFLPMENIAQLEIIKGASSVLYGSSALSGVIHFRTAYPTSTDKTSFQTWMGGYQPPKGNQHYWKGIGKKTGFNFSHAEKRGNWSWLLATTVQGDDGSLGPQKDSLGNVMAYDHNPFTVDRYKGENRSRINFQTRYSFKKIKGLNAGINAIIAHSESNSTMIWQDSKDGLFGAYNGSTTYSNQLLSAIDPYIEYNGTRGARHSLRNRWQSLDNNNSNKQGNFSDVLYSEYQYQQDWESWGVPNLTTTLGIVNSYTQGRGQLFTGGNPDGRNSAQNHAAYLQVDGHIKKRLFYSAGCRYEQFQINDQKEGKPVFRMGLNYSIGKATYLRGSYGQGYRFPSIAEKFVVTSLGAIKIFANPDIHSETSDNMEFAIKQGFQIKNFKGFIDVAVFQQRFNNFIEFTFGQWDPNPSLNNMLGIGFKSLNTGKAQVRGAECSIMGTGKINEKTTLDILAGYTYTAPISRTPDLKYAHQDSTNVFYNTNLANPSYQSTSSDASNNILKYRLQHLVRVDVSLNRGPWNWGNSFRYNSHMQNIDVAFQQLETQFPNLFNPGIIPWREQHKKGDYVWDMRVGYSWNKQRVNLVMNNVLNRIYSIRPLALEDPRSFMIQYSIQL